MLPSSWRSIFLSIAGLMERIRRYYKKFIYNGSKKLGVSCSAGFACMQKTERLLKRIFERSN
jgi:hypothetical protein